MDKRQQPLLIGFGWLRITITKSVMQNGKKIHEKEIEEWEEDRRARFYFEKRDFL